MGQTRRKLSDDKRFLSKGEFAHDVAISIQQGEAFAVPAYLRNAITGVLSEPGASGAADQAE
jgi:putative ATP-dependent endonuclease of OLD family